MWQQLLLKQLKQKKKQLSSNNGICTVKYVSAVYIDIQKIQKKTTIVLNLVRRQDIDHHLSCLQPKNELVYITVNIRDSLSIVYN